jgi:uncharacterized protein (TIGR02594 family)
MVDRLMIVLVALAAALAAFLYLNWPVRAYDDPSKPVYEWREAALPSVRSDTLAIARAYLGTNPTGRRSLWCADYVNLVERKAGRAGTGSRMARSYLSYGSAVSLSRARPGDIVVLSRGRRGGHVGYFKRLDGRGNPVLISGNACSPRRVCVSTYPRSRVLGVRRP